MKFDELLHQFRIGIEREYGLDGPLKIALEPRLFEAVVFEFYKDKQFAYMNTAPDAPSITKCNIRMQDAGEFFIEGIQIVCREKDKF